MGVQFDFLQQRFNKLINQREVSSEVKVTIITSSVTERNMYVQTEVQIKYFNYNLLLSKK
jgi:hypothetical protein